MKDRQERGKPRFDHKQALPTEIPEGMELYKFYGQPVLIPARDEGEELVGNTTYTARQLQRLRELSDQRNAAIGVSFAAHRSVLFDSSRVNPQLIQVRELLRRVVHGEEV